MVRPRAILRFSILATWVCSPVFAQTTIEGRVPLPDSPPAAVMAKRYEIVSKGGVLSTVPPVAVVWLEGEFPEPEASPAQLEIAQRDFVFEPALLPIRVGDIVAFPNYDSEYHNVFSYSKPNRFDLGRYMPDEQPVPTQTFDQPGVIVLRCDIHEHMRAIIIVLDTPHFTQTDLEGNFVLEGIPDGDYTLKAWVDTNTTLEIPLSVAGHETIEAAF